MLRADSAFLVYAVAVLCTFAASSARAQPTPAPRKVEREAKRAAPVGGQFLSEQGEWQKRLPAATGEGPPLLFMLSRAQLASSRWGWELPALARAMAEELAAVLDDGCVRACGVVARNVRERLRDFLDDSTTIEAAPRARNWLTDESGYHTWHRNLSARVRAGLLTVDVDCICHSATVGMRVWNDVTTCDATVRERGRVLARYLPRVRLGEGKLSEVFPLAAFSQTVQFPEAGELLIESGYNYEGDGKKHPYEKDGIRGRVVVVGNLIAP